ncbi:MAG: hypothetical protein KDA92_00505 [Planctomycetales bacterium]|nr:hypothetical protein [Planctomycetales bacterium]MCA9166793.1 hypothetical protein [Planctomycetales bacterium]
MSTITHWLNKIEHTIRHLDGTDYILLTACVVLIGFACMRGFGSRTNW